ncbi:MAG: hypothetical protein WDW36_000732 [Sanguina aurantia]
MVAFQKWASTILALVSNLQHHPTTTFVQPGACQRVESMLTEYLVGQELAQRQLVDAVCSHIDSSSSSCSRSHAGPKRPLVISVHGPPGAGKTYTHTLLARALYNSQPDRARECPGKHCLGRKVVYGLDFTQLKQASELDLTRNAILAHIRDTPDPLIVIEEYDKLDCPSRSMLRQFMQHPELANGTFSRAIVLLESNLGYLDLMRMLTRAGDRSKISMEDAERMLKELVYNHWRKDGCEGYDDTLRFTSAIDFFIPFFPLQKPQIEKLMVQELKAYATSLREHKKVAMVWDKDVLDFLVRQVEFDGGYPLEGAKQVKTKGIRYLSRLERHCPHASRVEAAVTAAETSRSCRSAGVSKSAALARNDDGERALTAEGTVGSGDGVGDVTGVAEPAAAGLRHGWGWALDVDAPIITQLPRLYGPHDLQRTVPSVAEGKLGVAWQPAAQQQQHLAVSIGQAQQVGIVQPWECTAPTQQVDTQVVPGAGQPGGRDPWVSSASVSLPPYNAPGLIQALRNGATDYILKQNPARLASAVRRALAEADARRASRRAEAELIRAQRFESLAMLAGGLSHDLRNLLQPLLLAGDSLQDYQDDPRLARLGKLVRDCGKRGLDMVQSMLSFARGARRAEEVRLGGLLNALDLLLQGSVPRSIVMEMVIEDAELCFEGNHTELQQCLLNLCLNAIQAMPDGGQLRIETAQVALPLEFFAPEEEPRQGMYLRMSVVDSGAGMSPDVLARLFEPFFTTKETGTGLGLLSCKRIVSTHGGVMRVESAPGKGTHFDLYIPLEELTTDSEQAGTKDGLEGSAERILVVVEEAGQLSLMVDTLDAYGYQAHASQSGTAALQWIEACGLPDLVVLDADMNLYTGVRTLNALTEHGYVGAVILLGRPDAPPDLHELPPFEHLYVINKPITTQLPPEVYMVYELALKMGLRPGVVERAAARYSQIAAALPANALDQVQARCRITQPHSIHLPIPGASAGAGPGGAAVVSAGAEATAGADGELGDDGADDDAAAAAAEGVGRQVGRHGRCGGTRMGSSAAQRAQKTAGQPWGPLRSRRFSPYPETDRREGSARCRERAGKGGGKQAGRRGVDDSDS